MLLNNLYKSLIIIVLVIIPFSCSDDILDEINKNPNSPTDVPISLLLPQSMVSTFEGIAGNPAGVYASLFVEHATNVHLNPRLPSDISGFFNSIYAVLNDLKVVIEKGSDGGSEAGQYHAVGIAKFLYVYTLSIGTDLFGEMPHSEALQGSLIRQPKFDSQQEIYSYMLSTLDEAIADFNKTSITAVNPIDLQFNGNIDLWKKSTYALKARLLNRLSNVDPKNQEILSAISNSFTSADESMIFNGYLPGSSNDNPWTAYQKSQQGFAISSTFIDILNSYNESIEDPRAVNWFTKINDAYAGAQPGGAEADLSHTTYSAPSIDNVLFDDASQPLLTYDEIKFIEAEVYFRMGEMENANSAYQMAVTEALKRAGIDADGISTYTSQSTVFPSVDNLTLKHIIEQKYISFWMFQSLEAFNDQRRTGIPEMQNPFGTPNRIPYPNSEIDRNLNTPSQINDVTIYTIPLWWQKK
ncbi:MAG: SusD/RagB family nutrient-binding outer membrane lipoprotein [Saprospiraceae bacterium]|nr:SusD/RagB family nutrient-binding outer membrane lipoprotein [Saprospiraceae bacterium]